MDEITKIAEQASDAARSGDLANLKHGLGELYSRGVFRSAASRAYNMRGRPSKICQDDLEHDLYLHCSSAIGQYRPVQCFRTWLTRVCHNLLVSQLRRKSTTENSLADDWNPPESSGTTPYTEVNNAETKALFSQPFSNRDWSCIRGWRIRNFRDPIVVLVGAGFVEKIDQAEQSGEWQQWLVAAGVEDPATLMVDLRRLNSESLRVRLMRLGLEFGLTTYNSIWQDWNRKRHLLVELDFFWTQGFASFKRFSLDQNEQILKAEPSARVAILSVDVQFPRAKSPDTLNSYCESYGFRGIPPWLKYLEVKFEDRIDLLVQATSSKLKITAEKVVEQLSIAAELRQTLQVSDS